MTRARDVANLIGSGNFSSTTFTATAGQTAFTISHTQGFIQVFMNGLLLDETVDYTSNGSAVTLTSGAAAGDEIEVVAYNTFSVGDALPKSGGAMTGALTVDAAGATTLTVDRATSDGTIIDLQKDGTSVGKLGIQTSGFYIDGESGHEGIRFGNGSVNPRENGADSDGTSSLGTSSARWSNLYLTGGAYIGGTGASNKLDDFEEGTYTYTLTGQTSGSESIRSGYATFAYTKIGRMVKVMGRYELQSSSGAVGNLKFSLPFTQTNALTDQADTGVGTISIFRSGTQFETVLRAVAYPGNAFFYAIRQTGSGSESIVNASETDANYEGFVEITIFTD